MGFEQGEDGGDALAAEGPVVADLAEAEEDFEEVAVGVWGVGVAGYVLRRPLASAWRASYFSFSEG